MRAALFSIGNLTPTDLSLQAQTSQGSFSLEFNYSEPMHVPTSNIALVAASLCGNAFDSIRFDFPVEDAAVEIIRGFTRAQVDAERAATTPQRLRQGFLLSFSGGFDSLAALAVMPPHTRLVSIDFGGHFAREGRFFSQFEPIVISTNVRDTPLVHNSWAFMALGALLVSDHANARYHSFGSILASSISRPPKPGTFSLLRAAGMTGADYVRGITEVGTAMIILRRYPELLERSLSSLAGPQDEKGLRKTLLSLGVAKELGISLVFSESFSARTKPVPFGRNFANDFISCYLAVRSGEGSIFGIPDHLMNRIRGRRLGFMEKYNPDFYEFFPNELLPDLYHRFAEYGIHPYTSADWTEFEHLKDELLQMYPNLR